MCCENYFSKTHNINIFLCFCVFVLCVFKLHISLNTTVMIVSKRLNWMLNIVNVVVPIYPSCICFVIFTKPPEESTNNILFEGSIESINSNCFSLCSVMQNSGSI